MKFLRIFITFLTLVLLPACTKQKHVELKDNFRSLTCVSKYRATWHKECDDVSVRIKKLNKQECYKYFDCNVLSYGYQPIIITIANQSNDFMLFQPQRMGLPLISPFVIAKKCHWNTALFTGTLGCISAIFLWPALIPVACGGYYMSNNNKEITQSLISNSLDSYNSIEIAPQETIDRVFFVENEEVPAVFVVSLLNKDAKKWLNFEVVL